MKKPLFNKVCIVGVGLIGGSLGMAIKKRKLAKHVIGVARRRSVVPLIREFGAADEVSINLRQGVKDADLVILATPIDSIMKYLKKIKPFLDYSTLVIDVGSTKEVIEQAAIKAGYKTWYTPEAPGPEFIGCHPLTGSEKTGVQNSSPDLFKNATCFVCDGVTRKEDVIDLWKKLGAKVIEISADSHDSFAAHISHIPHLLAFLMFFGWEAKYPLANPSFREILRLSKSDAILWAEIFCSNSKYMRHEIDILLKGLKQWRRAIVNKNKKEIINFIQLSQSLHQSFEI